MVNLLPFPSTYFQTFNTTFKLSFQLLPPSSLQEIIMPPFLYIKLRHYLSTATPCSLVSFHPRSFLTSSLSVFEKRRSSPIHPQSVPLIPPSTNTVILLPQSPPLLLSLASSSPLPLSLPAYCTQLVSIVKLLPDKKERTDLYPRALYLQSNLPFASKFLSSVVLISHSQYISTNCLYDFYPQVALAKMPVTFLFSKPSCHLIIFLYGI